MVLSSLTWSLDNSPCLVHNFSAEISLGFKHQAWCISSLWSPDHLRSALYFLSSGKLASSTLLLLLQILILSIKSHPWTNPWQSLQCIKVDFCILVVDCLFAFKCFSLVPACHECLLALGGVLCSLVLLILVMSL